MSASESSMPGGHPSITQPMAGPCDSPKLVTANRVPKVLPLMGGLSDVSPSPLRGDGGVRGATASTPSAQPSPAQGRGSQSSGHSEAVGCESSDDGQSRMYALSIRFSKFWLSTTALATS